MLGHRRADMTERTTYARVIRQTGNHYQLHPQLHSAQLASPKRPTWAGMG